MKNAYIHIFCYIYFFAVLIFLCHLKCFEVVAVFILCCQFSKCELFYNAPCYLDTVAMQCHDCITSYLVTVAKQQMYNNIVCLLQLYEMKESQSHHLYSNHKNSHNHQNLPKSLKPR